MKATARSVKSMASRFWEIEDLFERSPRVAPDPKHSVDGDRLIAVGRTSTGRPLFVAFTIRTNEQTPLHPSGDGPVYAR
jgi:uncharacterized DUF497 family protein